MTNCQNCMDTLSETDCYDLCGSRNRHPSNQRLQAVPDLEVRFIETLQDIADANVALLLRKHRDYGPKNIADAPGGALNGLRVRMHDKLARINHLIDSGATAQNEPLRDSFLDLANYGLIALMVLDGEWPGADDE